MEEDLVQSLDSRGGLEAVIRGRSMDSGAAFGTVHERRQLRERARRDLTPETMKERRKLPDGFFDSVMIRLLRKG